MSTEILTLEQSQRLVTLESKIKVGIATFIDIGEALAEIRDSKLYKVEHDTFESYCREKWGFSRFYAHRVMEASSVSTLLPIGNKPTHETQVRPLTSLPDEDVPKVWAAAVESAGGGQPTEKQVRESVAKFKPPPAYEWSKEAIQAEEEVKKDGPKLYRIKADFKKLSKEDKQSFLEWLNTNW